MSARMVGARGEGGTPWMHIGLYLWQARSAFCAHYEGGGAGGTAGVWCLLS